MPNNNFGLPKKYNSQINVIPLPLHFLYRKTRNHLSCIIHFLLTLLIIIQGFVELRLKHERLIYLEDYLNLMFFVFCNYFGQYYLSIKLKSDYK